jgi:mRNA interferase MazF
VARTRKPVTVTGGPEYLGEVSVAPITSTVRGIPSEVPLGTADGVPRDCAVNLDHVPTIAKSRLVALVATLPAARLEEVRSALLFARGFRRDAGVG